VNVHKSPILISVLWCSVCEDYPRSHTAKCTWHNLAHNKPNSFWLRSWFKHLHHLACCMLLLGQGTNWTVELKIDISMNIMKKSLQQNKWRLPVIRYYNNHNSEHLYAFLCSVTGHVWTHSHQCPDNPALPSNLNIMKSFKPKKCLRKCVQGIGWHGQSAPNFIAQGLHLQQELFEKNKSRKW
jgi:hypothetical protein